MPKISAGVLMYCYRGKNLRVLLVHPGGPFFRNKDDGSWSIPKGEADAGEDLFAAARREFAEETGFPIDAKFIPLTPVKLKNGKVVHAWAIAGEIDTTNFKSNTFTMQWPPGSGKRTEFPEVDQACFFDIAKAKIKINPAQVPLLDELLTIVAGAAE